MRGSRTSRWRGNGAAGTGVRASLVGALLAFVAIPVGLPAQDDLAEELDRYMTDLEERGFSGGLLVTKGGEVVLSRGYGLADRSADRPFTAETVFPVGSLTKQFTGALILALEADGALSVEDRIAEHFDGVPPDKRGITLHHLLTHSAGLPDALGFDFAEIDREAFVDRALGADLAFEPGSGYAYSNVGYSLLAAVIERVTGRSYDDVAREHLFGPAGMTRTGYDLSRYGPEALAHGYRGDRDWGTFADKPWDVDGPYWHLRGNGGILSTLEDMLRWHRALQTDEVLPRGAVERYQAPHVREGENAPSYYGYGWVVQETARGRLVWHDGGNPYFSSEFRRYLDADVAIFLTSNTGDFRAPDLTSDLAALVFGES